MHQNTLNIIFKWLKEAGYTSLDKAQFEISFLSHPDVGAAVSITDTLTEFGIENAAIEIEIASLNALNEPFLAYLTQDYREEFVLLIPQNNETFKLYTGQQKETLITFTELQKIWTGTIIVIDKNSNPKKITFSKYQSNVPIAAITAILLILFVIVNPSVYSIGHFILAIAGLFISGLIVNHQLGYGNDVTSKFCQLNKNTDCNTVLNSAAAKLTNNIGLSDIGVVYFASQIGAYFLVKDVSYTLFGISLLALPFVGYSLYQQKFVIKKWCPLCLGVIGVLTVQGLMALSFFLLFNLQTIAIKSSFSVLLVVSLIMLIWKLLFPILKAMQESKSFKVGYLAYKRNYYLFLPFYKQQTEALPTYSTIADEIIIGNKKAIVQLTLVTDPICHHCQRVYKTFESLLSHHSNKISLKLIFNVPIDNPEDSGCLIAAWLSKEYCNNRVTGAEKIARWYNEHDYDAIPEKLMLKEDFKEMYPLLNSHKQWCLANNISLAPLVFINGKQFPVFYEPTDIKYHIEELIAFEENYRYAWSDTNAVLVDNT